MSDEHVHDALEALELLSNIKCVLHLDYAALYRVDLARPVYSTLPA